LQKTCFYRSEDEIALPSIDRIGIAARLRALLAGQDDDDLSRTAARLGIEEVSLRMSIDALSPHPTVEVLAAVIQQFGVDPSWLLTGRYDATTHRTSIESEDIQGAVRDLMVSREFRIAELPSEPSRLFTQN
jgi:hypothetical protein